MKHDEIRRQLLEDAKDGAVLLVQDCRESLRLKPGDSLSLTIADIQAALAAKDRELEKSKARIRTLEGERKYSMEKLQEQREELDAVKRELERTQKDKDAWHGCAIKTKAKLDAARADLTAAHAALQSAEARVGYIAAQEIGWSLSRKWDVDYWNDNDKGDLVWIIEDGNGRVVEKHADLLSALDKALSAQAQDGDDHLDEREDNESRMK